MEGRGTTTQTRHEKNTNKIKQLHGYVKKIDLFPTKAQGVRKGITEALITHGSNALRG